MMKWLRSAWFRAALAMLIAVSVVALTAGCNTVRGVGEDIESLGRGVQKGSEKVSGNE